MFICKLSPNQTDPASSNIVGFNMLHSFSHHVGRTLDGFEANLISIKQRLQHRPECLLFLGVNSKIERT